MKASRRLPFLIAGVLACSIAVGQFQGTYTASVNLPIPPSGSGGGAGGCVSGGPNTTEFTLSVPEAFMVSHVKLDLTLTHSYVGDLTLTLSHCGTAVVLYDRNPGSSSNLSGTYSFDDQATITFASVVTTPSLVPTGSYLPVSPLSPFFGKSSAGDWKITICDQASGDTGLLTFLSLTLSGLQTYGGTVSPPISIPDGFNGCSSPVARAINVPTAGTVDEVALTIGLNHPFVRDLDITLAHDGVVVAITIPGTINIGIGVNGLYTFTDQSALVQSFTAAGNALPQGSTIAPGYYHPASPLSAFIGHSKQGVWMVTVCDTSYVDTGTLTYASLLLSDSAWDLTLSQPIGPGSLVFTNEGGLPGDMFLNLVTLVPGSFPNGWLDGLDISISDIVFQVGLGPPIIGWLGPCGGAVGLVPGPIPSGIPIQLVSFELDASGTPVAFKHAFEYVTQ